MKQILIAIVLLGCTLPYAYGDSPTGAIQLRSGSISGPLDRAGLPVHLTLSSSDLEAGGAALVKLSEPLTRSVRDRIESRGIRLSAPLGPDSFIAWLPQGGIEMAGRIKGVEWAAPYHPGLRIAPELLSVTEGDPRARIPITLHLFAHVDPDEIVNRLELSGQAVRGTAAGRLATNFPEDLRLVERAGRIVLTPTPAELIKLRESIASWPELCSGSAGGPGIVC